MVWFQCEDCGDNLKKPKLPNHFRTCSATKLSCIDCGQTFGQESVQGHTQCITEAEKYGPKGQGKASNGTTPKNNKDLKQQSSVDVNVGLSERPPWFCSLCNTKATSKQALLIHAEGKRHRAKARAFLVASGQSQQIDNSVPGSEGNGTTPHGKVPEEKHLEQPQVEDLPKVDEVYKMETDNVSVSLKKKRKIDAPENYDLGKKLRNDTPAEGDKGEVIQGERTIATEIEFQSKEDVISASKSTKEDSKKKIKWKKLITSTLRNNPVGVMKIKKLRKLVLKAIQDSGASEDETHLKEVLEHKITSSSKFVVDKKFVKLAVKD